ncbi:SubName: Full=Uncharacterized protein {ECO:0000313/EMBL:CCA71217.1} [Serendipita indica DSM 11827]|nr:SubName: Full=Uncharacterized protein {ECO:0000313/EMBL:CCA71217.1} [Serendipita indica DSM 11827]
MTSTHKPPKATKKVFISSRGGSRTKGADAVARANVPPPPRMSLEAPLPRLTEAHYARGGEANSWKYVVEDGVFESALAHDQHRLRELGWKPKPHRPRSLRGGPAVPQKDRTKSETSSVFSFGKRTAAASITTLDIQNSLSADIHPSGSSIGQLEDRLYELSITSSEDVDQVSLSNFTAPSFLEEGEDDDVYSQYSVEAESFISESAVPRARSLSLSSAETDESLGPSEALPTRPHRRFSLVSPGVVVFKPDEPRPLSFDQHPHPADVALQRNTPAIL